MIDHFLVRIENEEARELLRGLEEETLKDRSSSRNENEPQVSEEYASVFEIWTEKISGSSVKSIIEFEKELREHGFESPRDYELIDTW